MIAESQVQDLKVLELVLTVDDPEVVHEVLEVPSGPQRQRYVQTALRLGVLALRQASGALDAGLIRREGERILNDLDLRLGSQLRENLTRVSETLKRYFDPASGDLAQRLERLVRKDGELESLLARHLGAADSTVARTLAAHIGEHSAIFKLLSPDQSSGILAALRTAVETALTQQRQHILGQFSLDDDTSALSRLVREMTGSNGKLQAELGQHLARVREEFSLDNENGALARLVGRVEKAQRLLADEFSLDQEGSALSRIARLLQNTSETVAARLTLDDDASPLSRLRRELLDVVGELSKANHTFHTEVRVAVAALGARRAEAARSTSHGGEFQDAVGALLQAEAQRLGDVLESVGSTTGALPYCKKGDHVLTLAGESAAPGARIVCESKEDKSYSLAKARTELDEARRNRRAQAGVFIFSQRSAPDGLEPLARYESDIVVVWNSDDPTTDVYLKAAVSLARALVVRERVAAERSAVDMSAIDLALARLTQDAQRVEHITKLARTICNHGEKIVENARKVRQDLDKQVDTLREHAERLRPVLSDGSCVSNGRAAV